MELVSLEQLVSPDHPYRKYLKVIDIESAMKPLEGMDNVGRGADGYGVKTHFKFLLLQFLEDNSDREHERFLAENTAAKWFCGLPLNDKSPDHSTFCRMRKKIGTKRLSQIFGLLQSQLKKRGYLSEIFVFVDSSKLISKNNLWAERDKLLAQKIDKLGNNEVPKVAKDKQARVGCKGKNKYWYGYKKHTSVDMQSGLIHKIAVTPANVSDSSGLKHICPKAGAVYGDKGYCGKGAARTIKMNGCHNATIKRNNMKSKNKDLDRWHTKLRAPYERVFSKNKNRVRYNGIAKNQFTEFMNAIGHNVKRMVVLTS